MDVNWRTEEALMTVRDGIQLTPEQEARMQIAQADHRRPRDLRRSAALVLVALARRLDPESARSAGAALVAGSRPSVAGP
jgi:hypothetical protein